MAVSTMTGYADHLERDGRAITGAASAAGPAAPIPSCPQWTMTDLLHHVEQACRGISALVSLGVTEVPGAPPPLPPPAGGDPVAGFGEQVAVLVSTLRETRPDKPVWNWAAADGTADFWARRMALDVTVHRWDAQHAAGAQSPTTGNRSRPEPHSAAHPPLDRSGAGAGDVVGAQLSL